jgi:hypothetical protein
MAILARNVLVWQGFGLSQTRRSTARRSKRGVGPYGVYGDRAAVRIVCGVSDELIVEAERQPFLDAKRVVGFAHRLFAVVESTIADQYSQSAGSEVGASYWG